MVKSLFLSIGSAICWFLVFAISCGVATFVESYYNTATAWAMIYGTAWFGLVQIILGVNLVYNIFAYKLINLKKLPALIFHISFIFILLGAGLTRYFGIEGVMSIRNGNTSNEVQTSMSYIQLRSLSKDGKQSIVSRPMYLSSFGKFGENSFSLQDKVNGKKVKLKYSGFMPNATYEWQTSSDNDAKAVLELVFSNDAKSHNIVLLQGEELKAGDISISFDANKTLSKFIEFSVEDGKFYINTNQNLSVKNMHDTQSQDINGKKTLLNEFSIYTLKSNDEIINFTIKTMLEKAKQVLVPAVANMGNDVLKATLSYDGKDYPMEIFINNIPDRVISDDTIFEASFNPMKITLPFSLTLQRFEMLRYPGSSSPMSYSSYVKVDDSNESYDYHIYMNHVLDHGGYRFFQSSYDRDEQGTILSVNQDPGKLVTYFGYFLLGLGFFLNLISPFSRFTKLSKLIAEQNLSPKVIKKSFKIVLFSLLCINFSNQLEANTNLPRIDKSHVELVKTLIVQSQDGRMKPFDTLANELLNKLYRSNSFGDMQANETVLSMILAPSLWREVELIKISDPTLKQLLGMKPNQKYASFNDFFIINGENSDYKLLAKSEEANRKPLSARGVLDKEIIKADEKINILYMIFSGEFLRIFPAKDDPNQTWHSPTSALMTFVNQEQSDILSLLQRYFTATEKGISSSNWQEANTVLEEIKKYQATNGSSIMPTTSRLNAEFAFNKYQIFKNLILVYLFSGLALLIVVFIRLIKNVRLNIIFNIVYVINILAFVAHTIGLGLRWYISGHAPWSDAYESLVYIAWALALSGIMFSRCSAISLSLTSILAGCTLFVAHLSWIDPQITNLKPVLQSYWLTIHVSVITASYGFLGLCSLLAMFTLVLFSLQGKKENLQFSNSILEATRINEMAMILGLSLLTFGNFLGGIWANESWGRYWGWDSKETWALISILVYAAVLHLRFVKNFNTQYTFAVASMFAYWVIIFTYFGVNFYLTGLHSYAAGDRVQVPVFVYIMFAIMIILSITGRRGMQYNKKL